MDFSTDMLNTREGTQFNVVCIREKRDGNYGDEWLADVEPKDGNGTISFTKLPDNDNRWSDKKIERLKAHIERAQNPYGPAIIVKQGKAFALKTAQ